MKTVILSLPFLLAVSLCPLGTSAYPVGIIVGTDLNEEVHMPLGLSPVGFAFGTTDLIALEGICAKVFSNNGCVIFGEGIEDDVFEIRQQEIVAPDDFRRLLRCGGGQLLLQIFGGYIYVFSGEAVLVLDNNGYRDRQLTASVDPKECQKAAQKILQKLGNSGLEELERIGYVGIVFEDEIVAYGISDD